MNIMHTILKNNTLDYYMNVKIPLNLEKHNLEQIFAFFTYYSYFLFNNIKFFVKWLFITRNKSIL